jgi:hypothetical protein
LLDSEISKMLGFPVNVGRVLTHLKQDMRDDWYFDALQFSDIFDDQAYCQEVLKKAVSKGHGVYSSESPTVRGIPKSGLTERYALETDFFDRFVYQAAVSFLIPHIDPKLSNRVLSYRYEKYPLKKKYLFKNKIERWSTFEGITYTYRRAGKHLAVTDLSNFFDGISSDTVCKRMLEFVPTLACDGEQKAYLRAAINCLRTNLKTWSFRSGIGLPQNRDASSFLSNVMLSEVDHAMESAGFDYFRYVDDIRIICNSESEARTSISTLVRELRKFGFAVNAAKTKVLRPSDDDEVVAQVFTGIDTHIVAINNMWKSRSSRVVARSARYLCGIVSSCVANNDTQSRAFRFAVNRLSQLVQAGLIEFDDELIEKLKGELIQSLYDHAVSTDQYCRILIFVDPQGSTCPEIESYLLDSGRSIYDWQNYNLWLFLARHKHSSILLEDRARSIVQGSTKSGEGAAVLIWAMAVECTTIISEALKSYLASFDGFEHSKWPFLNQRYMLIAANLLSKEEIEQLWNKPDLKLHRTTSRSMKVIPENGIPIIDPTPPSLSLIIEEANDYT